jgi:acyl-coenzyme A synthetase/AMP-(fatty) acid ligase
MAKTVRNLINQNQDDDTAITSDNNQIITFKALKKQVHDISGQLAGHGINKNDRAVIVLPNGPEMATAFLAISSYMSAAPLNPSYKLSEYEFYLKDLKPKIVIVEKESTNAVVEAANKLNIEICEIKQIKEEPKGILIFMIHFQILRFQMKKMKL